MQSLCEQEKNLDVINSYFVCGAETENGVIKSVTAENILSGKYITAKGKYFIDCTGDGWLGYYAGAKYRIGREAKSEFNERLAPEKADTMTMSGCVMGNREPPFKKTEEKSVFEKPDWVPLFPGGKKYGRNIKNIDFVWWLEAPNDIDDVFHAEEARDELIRIIIGHFNYLKNLWDKKEKAEKYVLWRMPYYLAKRESRRLEGDYILNENDVESGKHFKDAVCHAGWPIDLHNPKGIYSGEEGPYYSNVQIPIAEIPFRCLYSKNIDNLFMAGRCLSVTHIALGTARLQNTILCEGQAAGTAAALCKDFGIMPRQLYEKHISVLQQTLIRDDQYIPGIKNEDNKDIARLARVSASSCSESEKYYPHIGYENEGKELDCDRAAFLPRGTAENIKSVWLKIKNTNPYGVEFNIHIRAQEDPDAYNSESDIAVAKKSVPAGFCGWIEAEINISSDQRYLIVWLEKCEGVFWGVWKYSALDTTRGKRHSSDKEFKRICDETHCVMIEKPVEEKADCSPGNVINGYSRIFDRKEYMWVSSERETLPQWLELKLDAPKDISSLHLTFDTDMTNPSLMRTNITYPLQLAKDYKVELYKGKELKKEFTVTDNYLRKRVHEFEKTNVDRVRITILDSGDGKTARIIECRLYE